MGKIVIALIAALMIAVQCLAPVSAASPAAELAQSTCGDTYVVQPLDYLAKIARQCGITVNDILIRNPQITNANLIYPGQVLRLTGDPVVPTTPPTTPTTTPPPTTPSSTYMVTYGDTLFLIAVRFGTTVNALLAANPNIWSANLIYVGQLINIPSGSYVPPTSPTSQPYYPPTNPTYGGLVSLSRTRVGSGETVTVSVSGFPANADIDFRLGKSGQSYSVAYDGVTGADGTTSATVTVPSSAIEGEYWIVRVTTTGMKGGADAYSPLIYIDN